MARLLDFDSWIGMIRPDLERSIVLTVEITLHMGGKGPQQAEELEGSHGDQSARRSWERGQEMNVFGRDPARSTDGLDLRFQVKNGALNLRFLT